MKSLISVLTTLLGGCLGICLIPFIVIGISLIDAWFAVVATNFVIDPLLVQFGSTFSLAPITFWMWVAIFIVIRGIYAIYSKPSLPDENTNKLISTKISTKLLLIVSLYIMHWIFL